MAKCDSNSPASPTDGAAFWLRMACVCLVAFICFVNAMQAGFAYDDSRAILTNLDLRPDTPWSDIFQNDFWGTSLLHSGSHKSYRPLCVLSFRLNYILGHLSPFGYHTVNVLLHCIVTCLVCYWTTLLSRDLWTGTVAGLVFASHPIHTEAVTGIVGRADVGATLFFLLSLLSYMRLCQSSISPWQQTALITLCVILAGVSMLIKEQGITVLGACVLYEVIINTRCQPDQLGQSIKRIMSNGSLKRISVVSLSALVLLYIRMAAMGNSVPHFAPSDNPASHHECFVARLLTFLYLPVFNFQLLLCPSRLSFDWSMDAIPLVESTFDFRNILTLAFYGSLLWIVYACTTSDKNDKIKTEIQTNMHNRDCNQNDIKKSPEKSDENSTNPNNGRRMSVFGLALMAVTFLPASNLLFYVGFVVAERLLYLPSVGYCLVVGQGARMVLNSLSSNRSKTCFQAGLLFLIVVFSFRTIRRNKDWKDEESLYRSGIAINPPKALGNLANILGSRGLVNEAEQAYKSALGYRPNMADAHYNLGVLLQKQNRLDAAIDSYRHAITYRPTLAAAHLNLGISLYDAGKLKEAMEVLVQAKEISDSGLKDPRAHAMSLTSIRYNIGKIYFEMEDYQSALAAFEDAITRMPESYEAHSVYNMQGQTYSWLGQLELAEECYLEALRRKPDHLPAFVTYAKHLHKTARLKEAEKWFRNAITMDETNKDSYLHFAMFLKTVERKQEALEYLEKALKLSPSAALYTQAADLRREMNDLDTAEVYYLKAVEIGPQVASHYTNYGAVLHLRKKHEQAASQYKRALELNPDDQLTRSNLKKVTSLLRRKAMNV